MLSFVMLANPLVEGQNGRGIFGHSVVWPHCKMEMLNFKVDRFCLGTSFNLDRGYMTAEYRPLFYCTIFRDKLLMVYSARTSSCSNITETLP